MEASCEAYLQDLNVDIEGGMGFILTSWDNTDGGFNINESSVSCPTPAANCDNAISLISDFKVFQWGYTEDIPTPPTPPPDPTPNPNEPADFQMFTGQSTQLGGQHEFYVKGLDGAYLVTSGDTIDIGIDNRAFVLDYPYDDDEFWSYWHNYFGGTLYFDVDVSNVGCECAAGIYLVELNSAQNCGWEAKQDGETPQCASIDVMEANSKGFRTQSLPCEFGVCDETSKC